MDWYAHVERDEHDLTLVAGEIRGSEPSIRKVGDGYQLHSEEFTSMTSSTEVRQRAEELLSRAVEAAAVGKSQRLRAQIGRVTLVDEDGKERDFIAVGASIEIRSRVRFNLTGGTPPKETVGEKVLRLGQTNEHVRVGAHLLNLAATWIDLFKVWDVLEEACGGEAKLLQVAPGISRRKLRVFKQMANNRSAVGDAARHAKLRPKAPAKPITLDEADRLMRHLFAAYLETLS